MSLLYCVFLAHCSNSILCTDTHDRNDSAISVYLWGQVDSRYAGMAIASAAVLGIGAACLWAELLAIFTLPTHKTRYVASEAERKEVPA